MKTYQQITYSIKKNTDSEPIKIDEADGKREKLQPITKNTDTHSEPIKNSCITDVKRRKLYPMIKDTDSKPIKNICG